MIVIACACALLLSLLGSLLLRFFVVFISVSRANVHTHPNAHTKFDILENYYQLLILLSLTVKY